MCIRDRIQNVKINGHLMDLEGYSMVKGIREEKMMDIAFSRLI